MQTKNTIEYRVKTFREAGLEARWTKRNCKPFISVRNPKAQIKHQRETWRLVSRDMFDLMNDVGIVEGFERSTLLGDVFSI